ncbi:MAG: hypothetical protein ACR2KZ_05430, partial [Segetibacter sp.]
YWNYTVQDALKKFAPKHREEYASMLMELLQHVTATKIEVAGQGFSLAEVPAEKRLNELEFDFNVPVFNPADLIDIEDENTSVNIKFNYELEGIMNGKMDMFFEHKGKYYILDWKSNFLGDSLNYYEKQLLPEAMSENNYHLQYLLYTIAAKKYLESRLPDFDYEKHFGGVIYLFVRGVRKGADTGIFTCRPAIEKINAMEKMLSY